MSGKKKVLVVDDERSFLEIVKLNLEDTGKYEVMTLSDAKDIISKIKAFGPQVIVLDLVMPSIGGLEVCEMLNNDTEAKNIPLIILSALSKDRDKLKAYKLGVTDYLVKPIKSTDLIACIEKCLRAKEEGI